MTGWLGHRPVWSPAPVGSLQPGNTASGGKSKRKHWVSGFPNSGLPAERTHRAGSL